jgi:hypothetical protein
MIGGKSYADMPECSPPVGATTVAQCDANGFFCCNDVQGASSARCGGQDRMEFPPDCHQNSSFTPHLPSGCYR